MGDSFFPGNSVIYSVFAVDKNETRKNRLPLISFSRDLCSQLPFRLEYPAPVVPAVQVTPRFINGFPVIHSRIFFWKEAAPIKKENK